jgi:hypothetical protein
MSDIEPHVASYERRCARAGYVLVGTLLLFFASGLYVPAPFTIPALVIVSLAGGAWVTRLVWCPVCDRPPASQNDCAPLWSDVCGSCGAEIGDPSRHGWRALLDATAAAIVAISIVSAVVYWAWGDRLGWK